MSNELVYYVKDGKIRSSRIVGGAGKFIALDRATGEYNTYPLYQLEDGNTEAFVFKSKKDAKVHKKIIGIISIKPWLQFGVLVISLMLSVLYF